MKQLRFTLVRDKDMLRESTKYYLYRSQEEERGRPIVDGVYIQQETIDENPPEKMTLLLEWT